MNRNRSRAAFGAAAVMAALLASGAGVSPAVAATAGDRASQSSAGEAGPRADKDRDSDDESKGGKGRGKGKGGDKGKGGGKTDAGKVAKAIDVADARLERLLTKAGRLSAEVYARFASNIATERAGLAQLTTVEAVKALRVENYEQVVAWLRKVEKATSAPTTDPAVSEAAAVVIEQLLSLSAASDKSDVRDAKDAFKDLRDLVKDAGEDDGSEDESPEDESPEDEGPEDESPEDESPEDESPEDESPEDDSAESPVDPGTEGGATAGA